MGKSRRGTIGALILAVLFLALNPQPAAAFTSFSTLCGDGSFNRCPYQPSTPLLDKQIDCVHCVAAGIQAYADFARIRYGWNARPTQDQIWTYTGSAHGTWGSNWNTQFISRQYNQAPPISCATYNGYRRAVNVSLDDGVDPYGQAWAMWDYTPPGFYYHQNVFSTGNTRNGRDYASHSAAWTLRNYNEPVGINIHNGGHFVLMTYFTSVDDPLSYYWTTINTIAYRDPIRDYPYQRIEYVWTDWWNVLSPYGWDGEISHTPYNCRSAGNNPDATNANCNDETHFGPWANSLWWGNYVVIERDQTGQNNPDWVWRNKI